jgi:SEC-C motif
VKVGRNEACPCGSGRKVKHCCGVEGVRDRVRRRDGAAAELFDLAFHFPRYRPLTANFDAWAQGAPEQPSCESVGEGLARLDRRERKRIVGGFQREFPAQWTEIVADFGDEALAGEIVLAGAVVVGVSERLQPLDQDVLDLLEYDENARTPIEALALTIDGGDLWSVIESAQAADALDRVFSERAAGRVLADEADRLATGWHDQRLSILIGRLRARLPVPEYPVASDALLQACDRFDSDTVFARKLRAELLQDSLPRVLFAAAAAA